MKLLILTVLSTLALVHGQTNCEVPSCLYSPKIGESLPVTEEEIQDECKDFRQFQDCLQAWTKECLPQETADLYNFKVEKTLKFIKALCGNQKFRQDYLSEKESFEKLSEKWKNCINLYQTVQKESAVLNNGTVEGMEICCGLASFSQCTEKLCESDCSGQVKDMLGRIIEMTKSGFDVVQCKDVDPSTCPTTSGSTRTLVSFVLAMVPVLAVLVFHR